MTLDDNDVIVCSDARINPKSCHSLSKYCQTVYPEFDEMSADEKVMMLEMVKLFPKLAIWIRDTNIIETWMISYGWTLLNYVSSDNVHGMRYNKDVKTFWCLGYKLS